MIRTKTATTLYTGLYSVVTRDWLKNCWPGELIGRSDRERRDTAYCTKQHGTGESIVIRGVTVGVT